MDKHWSISDRSLGARTIEENNELASRSTKKFNVTHKPLFASIPLTHVVTDNLHRFLHVSDVQINRFVIELNRHDSLEKVTKLASFDPSKHCHLYAFKSFVASLGIPSSHFYVGKDSKLLKYRTLTGPQLFRNISIAELLPKLTHDEVVRIQVLWTKLLEIHQYLSKRPEEITSTDIDNYTELSRQWVANVIDVYHIEAVTPYIHAMAQHGGEFVRIHGSLIAFTNRDLKNIMTLPSRITFGQHIIKESKPYCKSCRSKIALSIFVTLMPKAKTT